MNRTLLLVGLIVALLSLLADVLGIGRDPSFGWKQGVGLAVGIGLMAAGWYWGQKPKGPP